YAVALSSAVLPAFRPFDKPFDRLRGDLRAGTLRVLGSMVLPFLSVFLFSLAERKKKNKRSRTYAVGVLAGARGPLAPENLLFPPTCGGNAATGGWKRKGFFGGQIPPNLPTA